MTDAPRHDDLYSALGLPPNATEEDITKAYRRLAREHHPDANPTADANAFSGITDAYDTLRDPARRRAYDDTRQSRSRAAAAASTPFWKIASPPPASGNGPSRRCLAHCG